MKKHTHAIGFDIQKSYVGAVVLDMRSNTATYAAVEPLAAAAPNGYWDAVAKAVKNIRKNINNSAGGKNVGKNAVCAMPVEYAAVRVVEAAGTAAGRKDELAWELEASLLAPIDEYVCDYYEIDRTMRRHLALAVRKEAVAAIRKAMLGANFEVRIIDTDLFALSRALVANYRDQVESPCAVVHAESGCAKILLARRKTYVDHAVIDDLPPDLGGGDLAAVLAGEVDRLAAKTGGFARDGIKIFLAGSRFADGALAEPVERCEVFDPFKSISRARTIDGVIAAAQGPRLAVAAGLTLRGGES